MKLFKNYNIIWQVLYYSIILCHWLGKLGKHNSVSFWKINKKPDFLIHEAMACSDHYFHTWRLYVFYFSKSRKIKQFSSDRYWRNCESGQGDHCFYYLFAIFFRAITLSCILVPKTTFSFWVFGFLGREQIYPKLIFMDIWVGQFIYLFSENEK